MAPLPKSADGGETFERNVFYAYCTVSVTWVVWLGLPEVPVRHSPRHRLRKWSEFQPVCNIMRASWLFVRIVGRQFLPGRVSARAAANLPHRCLRCQRRR